MPTADADLVRHVADTIAIQSVKALYCQAADYLPNETPRAEALLNEVFTADVKAAYSEDEILVGRPAVVGFLVDTVAKSRDWVWHSIHTPRIEIDGDNATGYWTIVALMRAKGSTERQSAIGRYVTVFRRTPDGWKISNMRFIRESD